MTDKTPSGRQHGHCFQTKPQHQSSQTESAVFPIVPNVPEYCGYEAQTEKYIFFFWWENIEPVLAYSKLQIHKKHLSDCFLNSSKQSNNNVEQQKKHLDQVVQSGPLLLSKLFIIGL